MLIYWPRSFVSTGPPSSRSASDPSPMLARFCAGFFHEYNFGHRHSGITWHTPASVHFGTSEEVDQARQNTLTAA